MTTYNYEAFESEYYDFLDFPGPAVGEPMPALTFTNLAGGTVELASYRGKRVLLETGSITCPMYVKDVKKMQAVVAAHPDVVFVVMYVREAHPGKSIPAHGDAAMKAACAARLEETVTEGRMVLIDDLAGTAHRVLGSFPNMVYLIDADGVVTWRTNWSDTKQVAAILDGTATENQLRHDIVPPSRPTPWLAVGVLLRAGFGALMEFVRSLPSLLRAHGEVKRMNQEKDSAIGG